MRMTIFVWSVVILLTGFIGGGILMYAWNEVMPLVFDLPRLTFWNGFWMFWVAQSLTGGVFAIISAFMKDNTK